MQHIQLSFDHSGEFARAETEEERDFAALFAHQRQQQEYWDAFCKAGDLLFSGMPPKVQQVKNGDVFAEAIAQPTLSAVLFSARWCEACKVMKRTKVLTELAKKPGIHVYELDVDSEHGNMLADRYEADSLPTLIFFRDGKVVKSTTGVQEAATLSALVDTLDASKAPEA